MLIPDLFNPISFLITFFLFFIIILIRYLVLSGIFYVLFHKWYKDKWAARKVNPRKYSPKQFKRELKYSIISSFIFAAIGTICMLLWQKGYTKIYLNFRFIDWIYIPISFMGLLIIHESYYYWLHRWMHLPKVFKRIHHIHHRSNISSPFTAFSFHPLEGVIQAIFFPIVIILFPLHITVIGLLLFIMTVSSIINHLDIEIYPRNFNRHGLGKFLIGATHHSLHHSETKYNFGLYFTIWDKLKKTESNKFNHLFERLTEE